MANFIQDLDDLYKETQAKLGIKQEQKDFYIFLPLTTHGYGHEQANYIVRKGEFTKFLYCKNHCRVYFSDADILSMLLQVERESTIEMLIGHLVKVYRGTTTPYRITVGETEYEVSGMPKLSDGQTLANPQDIAVSFEELYILINLILSKDIASNPLWDIDTDFLKRTVSEYVALLKYYYMRDSNAMHYLKDMGYDIRADIYSNYATKSKRDKMSKLFRDFDAFEKSGII